MLILSVIVVPAASMAGFGSNATSSAGVMVMALVNCRLAPRMMRLTALFLFPKIGSTESMRGAAAVTVMVEFSGFANATCAVPAVSKTVRTPIAAVALMVTGIVTATPSGLAVGAVTTANSATVPSGIVISQNPAAGASVVTGTAVALVVSLGPAPVNVTVPNVVGQTQTVAQSAITGAGLTVGAISSSSSATVPAGQVISQTPLAGASAVTGTSVAFVLSSGPALGGPTVDAMVFSDGSGARTTPAFSTTGATVLIALAASDGPGTGTNTQSLTVSGAGLTWTRVVRAAASRGVSEIWTATAPAALTNVSVTCAQSTGGVNQSLTVVAFSGASGVGASSIASGLSGAPSASLATTADASVVYGVGNDFDQAIARTVPAGQTKVHEFLSPSGDTMWVQRAAATVAIAGTSVTLNDTAPLGDQWNFAIVEVKR